MTDKTIETAAKRAEELGIKYVVIASSTGASVEKALGKFANIVWVTHHFGYIKANEFEFAKEMKDKMQKNGVSVVTAAHVLSGAERGLSSKFNGYGPVEIMASTLRMFGQGVKVAVEVATMAIDAGAIPDGEKVIAIGGTGRGSDSALVLTPAHAAKILDTKIHEVITKP